MTERLPYEQQLALDWNDLPLPDENMAWADMKQRLEEEDDRPLPPFWLRGCAGWGLLGLLLLGLGWWFIRPEKWFNKKDGPSKEIIKMVNDQESDTIKKLNDTLKKMNYDHPALPVDSSTLTQQKNSADSLEIKKTIKKTTTFDPVESEKDRTTYIAKQQKKSTNKKPKTGIIKSKTEKNKEPVIHEKETTDSSLTVVKTKEPVIDKIPVKEPIKENIDSVKKMSTDSVVKKEKTDTTVQTVAKKDSTKKKIITFSAGIGEQQLLPIAGQQFTPYNSLGRKGSLADYIPSVYFRMTRPGKWFLQTEFRYGAPQYAKKLTYRQTIVPDTGSNPQYSTKTNTNLKKIYYHQLPLTFNYFIAKNLSLGAGVQWNKLFATISEAEIIRINNFTQRDSLVSKNIFSSRGDTASSVFKKAYWQGVVESQYQYKRFSFGARYTFGLQPYIQFTLPDGTRRQEKNQSFQLFIRYELWRSKNSR